MSYQAIYRKWRPIVFEDVIGQSHITETLKNELVNNKVAHAYLFCGTRGTGKTSTAKIFSRAVNCETPEPNGNPCNKCTSCIGTQSGTIIDIIEIDAASNNGVDDIRKLRDEIAYTPANVKYKVYIIDEVHMLSTGAFNALLKTLEEPPRHVIFILATTEPHKIPATIQSRCQRFDFRRISNHHISGRLAEIARTEEIKISLDAIKLIAVLSDGSMRDALSILDLCSGITGEITKEYVEKLTGITGSEIVFKTSKALISGDISQAIAYTNDAIKTGREITFFAEELLGFFRELLICKICLTASEILDKSKEDLEYLTELSKKATEEMIVHSIKTFSDTLAVCKWATNPRIILETAIVKICKPELDSTNEAFAARIKNLESAIVLGNLPVKTKDEPTDAVAIDNKKAKDKPKAKDDWALTVEAIRTQDAASAPLLNDTECVIQDGCANIIFKEATLKDFACKNENLVKLLNNSLHGLAIKFATHTELDNKQNDKSQPIDELIAKKTYLDDQMTIY
ncbi:MAG: DNA polymerase III subunit gamma/tau [Clostridiaceae bacterium]|nr:DNA polymerase III subunit gamma/tau [Clostridiaceae bacterium]